jgi:enoyl-CoA hydratase
MSGAAGGEVLLRPHPSFPGVAELVLARPARRNALDRGMIAGLRAACRRLAAERGLFAVVLRGEGGVFSAGADVETMAGLDVAGARAFITALHAAAEGLRALRLPVIAAIEGVALGAGLELAAAADLRLAVRGARFGMPEVRLGLPSVIEAALLPRLVGSGRARSLVLLGETIDAETALAWGLIDRLVEEGGMEEGLAGLLTALAAADPAALAAQKALCRVWEERSLGEAIQVSLETFARSYATGIPQSRLAAFRARRHREKTS